jgi:hypothetical protein
MPTGRKTHSLEQDRGFFLKDSPAQHEPHEIENEKSHGPKGTQGDENL